MPSFDSNPDGPAAQALRGMISEVAQHRDRALQAPRLVFDLRGNGGGSSRWSIDLAKALWGEAAVATASRDVTYVEWRVSDNNIATIGAYQQEWNASSNASPESLQWANTTLDGLRAARAAGKALWREPDQASDTSATPAPVLGSINVPVYIVTDWKCASACLDAVDLWTALARSWWAARRTLTPPTWRSAIERFLAASSASGGIPMKVWRGGRGAMFLDLPRHRYSGNMGDTKALEHRVALPTGAHSRQSQTARPDDTSPPGAGGRTRVLNHSTSTSDPKLTWGSLTCSSLTSIGGAVSRHGERKRLGWQADGCVPAPRPCPLRPRLVETGLPSPEHQRGCPRHLPIPGDHGSSS